MTGTEEGNSNDKQIYRFGQWFDLIAEKCSECVCRRNHEKE
jgi:hypothetical protein